MKTGSDYITSVEAVFTITEEWRILSQNPTDTMKTGSDYITSVKAVFTLSARELVPGKGSDRKWCCVHTG